MSVRDRSPITFVRVHNSSVYNNNMANYQEINLAKEMIPEYSGSTQTLSYFINKAERFITLFRNNLPGQENCTLNQLLLEIVISKINGVARDVLIVETPHTWNGVKNLLIERFGDPRNEDLLLNDLFTCFVNPGEHYETYCNRIKSKLQSLLEHVNLREQNADIRGYKVAQYNKIALNTFKTGIYEPYRSHLRYTNPNSLEACVTTLHEYDNNKRQSEFLDFIQKTQNNKSKFNRSIDNNRRPISSSFNQRFNNFSPQIRSSSFNPQNTSFNNQNYFRAPFRFNNPQNFENNNRAFNNNNNQNNNNNRNNNNNTRSRLPEGHTPMSISTRASSHLHQNNQSNRPNFFQATGPRNFISQELFNIESSEANDHRNQQDNNGNRVSEINFQQKASENTLT